jgi:uncharacterized protein YutE (UPF0331/DUF86 family)
MIEPDVIASRLARINENRQLLATLSQTTFEEFVSNAFHTLGAEHAIQICTQSVIDICGYLVTELDLAMTSRQSDSPVTLSRAGILPFDLAAGLSKMIGMRNIIVHEYLQVDLAEVYNVIQTRLGDYDRFSQCIVDCLTKEGFL